MICNQDAAERAEAGLARNAVLQRKCTAITVGPRCRRSRTSFLEREVNASFLQSVGVAMNEVVQGTPIQS